MSRRKLRIGSPEKHGMSRTPTYISYNEMLKRCYNTSVIRYPQYGGRGITVCDRWRSSFEAFLQDMGTRPKNKTLDRIDNDLGYSPENCKWSSRKEQMSNLQKTVRVTASSGETLTLAQWVEKTGIPSTTFRRYIFSYKLTVEEAISKFQGRKR